jgi:hypothetical protein
MLGPCFVVHWTAWMASSNTTTSGFSYFMGFTSFLSWKWRCWGERLGKLVQSEMTGDLVREKMPKPTLKSYGSDQGHQRNFAA